MFPFLNFHENFICLIWIVVNNFNLEIKINGLLSDPFTPIMMVTLQDFHLSTFLSVCCFNQGHYPFQWKWQGIKGVQTRDQEIKIVNFADDDYFLWSDINCFATSTSNSRYLILCKRGFPVRKYTLPGINGYLKNFVEVSIILYLFVSNHWELNTTMIWI